MQDAVAAHFVEGGYLDMVEIELCAAKLRGEQQDPTGIVDIRQDVTSPQVQKVFRDGRLLIIRDGVTYDAWGHIVDVK